MSVEGSLVDTPEVLESSIANTWHTVCGAGETPLDRGVAVLIDRTAVAVFRVGSAVGSPDAEELFAVAHTDPRTGVATIARGLVGSLGDRPIVASPLYKDRYDLRTGECLNDDSLALDTFSVRVVDGSVQVAASAESVEA